MRPILLTSLLCVTICSLSSAQSGSEQTNVASKPAPLQLIQRVSPTYPHAAQQARIQGAVVLEGVIGTDGSLKSATVISGHPLLVQSAVDAVKQWKYKPYVLDGKPVEVKTQITLQFALQTRPTDSTQSSLSKLNGVSVVQSANADREDSAKELEIATQGLKAECDQMPDGEPSYGSAYPNREQKAAKKACLAHANLDTCCQTSIQQLWYCKAWAADPEHMKMVPAHPVLKVEDRYDMICPYALTYKSKDLLYFRGEASKTGWSLTAQELAAARKVTDADEQRAKAERAEEERVRQQQFKQAAEDLERDNKVREEQQAKLMAISTAIWKRLGPSLHKGDSQSHVKAALIANGFTSPVNSGDVWYCSDPILQQDGYNWINGCVSRDKAGRSFKALFIIAQRHRDPDTGVIWNQRVDKLISFHYEDITVVDPTVEDMRLLPQGR